MPFKRLENSITELGELSRFFALTVKSIFTGSYEWSALWSQTIRLGYGTLPLISLTGFILGTVLTLQTQPVLVEFGAQAWLPGIVAVSIIKEIGPVVSGLICAGKIGSGIGAELGSMRVTEQIDAMEVSVTNPMKYLASTRVLATTIVVPLLVLYADLLSLVGSYFAINIAGNISVRLFIINVFESVGMLDVFFAFTKTIFFGFAIGLVGSYKGYTTERGTQGVGRSANAAVVISSLAIFLIDLVAVQIESILK